MNQTGMTGVEMIAQERRRQIDVEGHTTAHDDQHTDQSLPLVAIYYATPPGSYVVRLDPLAKSTHPVWPHTWPRQLAKKSDHSRIKQLVIAGGCIAAEIDRLQRLMVRAVEILTSMAKINEAGKFGAAFSLDAASEYLIKQGLLELRDGGLWITNKGREALPELQKELEEAGHD